MESIETIDKIKTRVVGIDIRVDRTTFAVVDIRGEIVAKDQFYTDEYPDINKRSSCSLRRMAAMRPSVLWV